MTSDKDHDEAAQILRQNYETPSMTAAERIADRILAAVAVGVLQPAERLPTERELAEMLGVSRTTVRQALGRLNALGVLESRRGRNGGTFVGVQQRSADSLQAVRRTLEPIRREFEALLDYRCLIEQLIARTAAERHTEADATAMRTALSAYREADSPARSREADRALHAAIVAAAGNEHLTRLAHDLVAQLNLGFSTDARRDKMRSTALRQHVALVAAIIDRAADRAADVASEHFQVVTGRPWRDALKDADGAGPD